MMKRLSIGRLVAIAFLICLFATPVKGQWTTLNDAIQPRVEGHSVVIDGKIYLFGGFQSEPSDNEYPDLVPIPDNEYYNPTTNSWTAFQPMPIANSHVGSAKVGKEVWLAGGFALIGFQQITDLVAIYDSETDTWRNGPSLPAKRAGGALVRNGRKLHFFSGLVDRDNGAFDHWVLDLDEPGGPQTWVAAAPVPVHRNHHSGISVGGKIYMIGGQQKPRYQPDGC